MDTPGQVGALTALCMIICLSCGRTIKFSQRFIVEKIESVLFEKLDLIP